MKQEKWSYGFIKENNIDIGIVIWPSNEIKMHDLGNTECRCDPSYNFEPVRGAYELRHKKIIGKIF